MDQGTVRAARVYTDAMDQDLSARAEAALTGCVFQGESLFQALAASGLASDVQKDLTGLLDPLF